MAGAPAEKWITGTTSHDPTSEVAVRSLKGRLGTVLHHLPLAAQLAGNDIEQVHQLRVWTRRATTALRVYEPLIPGRRFRWMQKQLKRIRRAANDARDCDVLIERLQKKKDQASRRWIEHVRAERELAQKKIVEVHDRLGRDRRFARRIEKLIKRVAERGPPKAGAVLRHFGAWARRHLQRTVDSFFEAAPKDPSDEAALHEFRIQGKELRYVIELLAGVFPGRLRTEIYPLIESIQDRLGAINDCATTKARLRRQIEAARNAREAAPWRRHLENEQAQLDLLQRDLRDWLSQEMLQRLRKDFDDVLRSPPLNGSAAAHDDPAPSVISPDRTSAPPADLRSPAR
jgi:CHAD domain-containing protein